MPDYSDTFPSHNIDPREKGFDWILQYARAAWAVGTGNTFSAFYNNAIKYREIKQYALGKQTITKYQKQPQPDKAIDNSVQNRDLTVVPIIPQFRNKALSKILQRKYDINAFAVDEEAQTQEDDTINALKLKIAMRQQLEQMNSPLANHPVAKKGQGEPEDMQQLEMMVQFGFKHNICMEAEMAADWLFNYNQFDRERGKMIPDQYDYGAGGYKCYIDENGKPRFRAISLENFMCSYCEQPDLSDASFMGEAIFINVSDIVPYFTPAEIQHICKSVAGNYSNPKIIDYTIRRYYDKFKVLVFDVQFLSFNTTVFKSNVDKYGNEKFGKTEFSDLSKIRSISINGGESEPKYLKNQKKVIYEAKWIVGTSYMYDYGLAKNQVRKPSSWWDTQFDFVIEAWNFNRMQFSGITEGLMHLADDYYMTEQKLQNIKRKLIPYAITVDLDGLENVNYGQNGDKWSPEKIMDLLFQSHVLVYRGADLMTGNGNQRPPMSIEVTNMGTQMIELRNEMQAIKNEMMEVSGYNAVTSGNPNPKTLNQGYDSANIATADSLWLISNVDRRLTMRLADLLIQKTQIAVKLGKIEGYSRAIGASGVKMFRITPDISLHEFAIFLDEAPTAEERQDLFNQMVEYDQKGLLEPQDRIVIENCRNLKQAYMLLSYFVNKRKQEQQQNALQMQQANAQTQVQSAQAAEQAKQQTIQIQSQANLQEINATGQWAYETAALKNEGVQNAAQIAAQAKIVTQNIIEQNKGKLKGVDANIENARMAHQHRLQQMQQLADSQQQASDQQHEAAMQPQQ